MRGIGVSVPFQSWCNAEAYPESRNPPSPPSLPFILAALLLPSHPHFTNPITPSPLRSSWSLSATSSSLRAHTPMCFSACSGTASSPRRACWEPREVRGVGRGGEGKGQCAAAGHGRPAYSTGHPCDKYAAIHDCGGTLFTPCVGRCCSTLCLLSSAPLTLPPSAVQTAWWCPRL